MDGSQAIAAGAALSAFSLDAQHDRLLRMDFPRGDGPDAILLPNRLSAREEVSRCFRFDAELLSDDAHIPLKAMMARMVTISLVRQDGSLRYFNGYVTEFRFLRADGGFAFYRMVLEPWLSFTRLRQDNVSFRGKSVRISGKGGSQGKILSRGHRHRRRTCDGNSCECAWTSGIVASRSYGKDWLKVVDGCGRTMRSWPQGDENALESVYLQPQDNWWRAINPDWVNPGNVPKKDGGGLDRVWKRLVKANAFLDTIETTFHPTHCYASYCASDEHKSYGNLVFKVMNPEVWDSRHITLPSADTWNLLTDDKKGTLTVQAGKIVLTLKLQPMEAAGDETVPAERSARKITGTLFQHGKAKGSGYDHQDSYADVHVLTSMLYSVANIAATAKWG